MMRIWGRVNQVGGYGGDWVQVTTDERGLNDWVYVTNLIQVLKLSRNESPFFANYGIPAQLSVVTQVFPDLYVTLTQQQFAGYFASLIVTKLGGPTPSYRINIVTHQGAEIEAVVPV